MIKPVAVKALVWFRIWVKFSDGVEGEVDLSHLRHKGACSRAGMTDPYSRTHAFQTPVTISGSENWAFALTRFTKTLLVSRFLKPKRG